MIGISASAQSNRNSSVKSSHSIALCSVGFSTPPMILHMNGIKRICLPGWISWRLESNLFSTWTISPSSSRISLWMQSSSDSLGSIFPPGSSHFNGRAIVSLRCAHSSLPFWTIKAHVTRMVFISPQHSKIDINEPPRFFSLSQPNLRSTCGSFAPSPISNIPSSTVMRQIISSLERWFLPISKTFF